MGVMTDDSHRIEDMYREEAEILRRFLQRKMSNPTDVEEVLQEAYLRLLRAAKNGEIENVRGFLYRIATNLVIDRFRSAAHNATHVDIDVMASGPTELTSADTSPEDMSIIRQQLGVTLEAIRDLPPRCRQVFVLHRIKQLTHREISGKLGISTQMVEKHIAKAVRICAEKVAPYR